MKKIFLFLYIIINIYKCKDIFYNHSSNETNLYFVLTSFRHGARETYFKKDYFNNKIQHPGQLTSYGAKQHLIIGKKYRKRYFNFLNLKNNTFNKEQIYIRTSHVRRAIFSTKKQLEGLFNSSIDEKNIDIVNVSKNFIKLYFLNMSEINKMENIFQSCELRKLSVKKKFTKKYFNKKIVPVFNRCYKDIKIEKIHLFCDNTISAFFEYKYNNQTDNKIGKCGYQTAKYFYDYCIEFYDSKRGWNETRAYIFNIFFNTIYKYMKDEIDGLGKLKMIMIGGHDSTVSPLMNFFDGLNLINRTEYPHFAYNVVFELRKYNDDFYLEIYYNDILKYNETLIKFKNFMDNSKYSNLYNYCGDLPIKDNNKIIIENNSLIQSQYNNTNNNTLIQLQNNNKNNTLIELQYNNINNNKFIQLNNNNINDNNINDNNNNDNNINDNNINDNNIIIIIVIILINLIILFIFIYFYKRKEKIYNIVKEYQSIKQIIN